MECREAADRPSRKLRLRALEYDRHAEDVVVTLRFWLEVDSVGGDHKWRGRVKDGKRWRKFDGLDGALRCLEDILKRVK